jgi:hypothetical protein
MMMMHLRGYSIQEALRMEQGVDRPSSYSFCFLFLTLTMTITTTSTTTTIVVTVVINVVVTTVDASACCISCRSSLIDNPIDCFRINVERPFADVYLHDDIVMVMTMIMIMIMMIIHCNRN